MSDRTFRGGTPSGEQKPRFNRSKTLQVILSILIAIGVWIYVDVEKAPERTKSISDIPVEFSGENTTLADKNLMLLSGYDATIDLKIRGPKRELVKLDRDTIRVVASTDSIDSVGVHSLRWEVSYPDDVAKAKVSVQWSSLSQITVTVGELYTKEIPVECQVIGEVAEGCFAGDVVLDPEVLTLRAQRDDLLNVCCARLTVDISGAARSVVQTVDVTLYDYDGNVVENDSIRTSASLIQARVPVLTTREVPLAVDLTGVPGDVMDSITCTISPLTVRITGETDVLAGVDRIVLATLDVDDLELIQQNSYVVTPPEGTWLSSGNEVATVEITLTGISETALTVTDIAAERLPEGLYMLVPESGLSVRLWGLEETIETIAPEDVRAVADMSAVTGPGSVTVPVTVTVRGVSGVTVRGSYELTVVVTDTPPVVEEDVTGDDTVLQR